MRKLMGLLLGLLAGTSSVVFAGQGEFTTVVDMQGKSTTFFVQSQVAGIGAVDFMVDTGSGYTTINEDILARMQSSGAAPRYLRQLRGRLANGSEINVPVYLIEAVSIGDKCWLTDVEAAVFPGKTRPILGLNALQRTAPFIFSFEPPRLQLSNCSERTLQPEARKADIAAFGE